MAPPGVLDPASHASAEVAEAPRKARSESLTYAAETSDVAAPVEDVVAQRVQRPGDAGPHLARPEHVAVLRRGRRYGGPA